VVAQRAAIHKRGTSCSGCSGVCHVRVLRRNGSSCCGMRMWK